MRRYFSQPSFTRQNSPKRRTSPADESSSATLLSRLKATPPESSSTMPPGKAHSRLEELATAKKKLLKLREGFHQECKFLSRLSEKFKTRSNTHSPKPESRIERTQHHHHPYTLPSSPCSSPLARLSSTAVKRTQSHNKLLRSGADSPLRPKGKKLKRKLHTSSSALNYGKKEVSQALILPGIKSRFPRISDTNVRANKKHGFLEKVKAKADRRTLEL